MIRELPQDIRVEQELLGSIMQNPDLIVKAVEHLKAEDFYKTSHQNIFTAICQLFAEGKDMNITLLVNVIGKENLQSVGGVTYLTELMTSGMPINPKIYIDILKEKSYRRKAIRAITQSIEKMYDEKEKPRQIVGELTDVLSCTDENKTSIMSEDKLLCRTIGEIEKRYQTGGEIPGMQTGFIDFDKATNGLKKGELFVIGGRPSTGKTLIALNIADGLGINKYKVLIVELEMTPESLGMRRLAYNSNIQAQKLQTGKLSSQEFEKLALTFNSLSQRNNIFTDCSSYQNILTIKSKAKAVKQIHGLDVLIIDHLTLMDIPSKGNRSAEIGEVTRQLKLLAKELDINIILLCQLSRAVEQRTDKRPIMSDLRESGNIEQDADLVMFAYRDEYYNPETEDKNIMEWIIAKQRNGRVGTLKFGYLDKMQTIKNLDYIRRD
ncbi:replicative DNA helicase [Clostridium saccharoperbutylacetonicum]|uniref:Replicative DNA helicase n=1 Tax=Clostridium saccharoperbutylacetonicum N1-4(HMT) TaxID=931276 RepID=M1N7V8_9CLOT|nr:replicative DNA helicase [Clostridium saccharoperbutylacetonicum]AGF59457.1 replicative DNA helicase DnaC [Clostridium saccharoperbutylacetonicum N1-4(HMT)]NRT59750.1 replicative DNA helicase [Clostridium saccharoperbutylacetonicum]NSB23062.1 replicative DNA helicase [Clostridium saccharoperbutylacetonicum]NSB42433.1 replicative DNA helicase [Clostridium saccharoperbutylacetonicum]